MNNVRLSAPYKESKAKELHDGDILQLGADYRGGTQGFKLQTKCQVKKESKMG